MFHLWLTLRFVTSGRRLLNLPSLLSLVGMTIGVACLVVAMAVVSGFEGTLKKSVQDVFGHVLLVKKGSRIESLESLIVRVNEVAPVARAFTPFLYLEAVLAHDRKINYVRIEGVDEKTVRDVLNIENRIIRGAFDLQSKNGVSAALIGKGIARKFNLRTGSTFKVVLPSPSKSDSTEFAPRVREFVVTGILDLGKIEYDERYIITDLQSAQAFAGVGENFSGVRVRLSDPELASEVVLGLERALGPSFFAMHWYEVNDNLFEAINYEKPVIFFVLLVMVVAASFNIASNLFVSVLKKFSDISILRAMGFSRRDVIRVFTIQGLVFGFLGTVFGIVLGLVLCGVFLVAQDYVVLMPPDVYKLDRIGVEIRLLDIGVIVLAALLITLLSTLTPAYRGSRLNPVEGLRYE